MTVFIKDVFIKSIKYKREKNSLSPKGYIFSINKRLGRHFGNLIHGENVKYLESLACLKAFMKLLYRIRLHALALWGNFSLK